MPVLTKLLPVDVILFNFFLKDNLVLQSISSQIKAGFRVGYVTADHRLNDLMLGEENKTAEEKDVNKQCTGDFYTEFYNSLGNMTYEGKKRSMTKFIRDFYLVNGYQTFVNNINTIEGGTHLSGFRSALTRAMNNHASKNNLIKTKKNEKIES